jgi:diguanylate cyclase (GGDEF)-like protein
MSNINKTILIVTSNDDLICLFEKKLKSVFSNIQILSTSSYKDSVKYILSKDTKIDVALISYEIPDVKDGLVIEFVLKKNIPVVALTDNEEQETVNKLLDLPIVDYIVTSDILGNNDYLASTLRVLKNYDTNILVVDNSPLQLKMAVNMLEKLQLNITTAMDGKEALYILQNSKKDFSLILTDYNMPIMNGMELTKEIRKQYDKDQLGIIVLSANDLPEVPTKFIKLGANDFINKPYKQIEVNTRINSNLETLELFQKIKDTANKDFLTGAYNRRYFFDSGEAIFGKAKREEKNLAVAMLDIDKFKNINDTYGHDIGDIAICEVANILNHHLRHTDLMARFGGEEFCVLLDNISLEDTQILFERIRASFETNILKTDNSEIKFTVSIGICYGLESTLEQMIKRSDDGLYYCKNNGRNQIAINK